MRQASIHYKTGISMYVNTKTRRMCRQCVLKNQASIQDRLLYETGFRIQNTTVYYYIRGNTVLHYMMRVFAITGPMRRVCTLFIFGEAVCSL